MIFLFTHSAEFQRESVSNVISEEAFGSIKDKLLQQKEDDFLFLNNTFMNRKYDLEEEN